MERHFYIIENSYLDKNCRIFEIISEEDIGRPSRETVNLFSTWIPMRPVISIVHYEKEYIPDGYGMKPFECYAKRGYNIEVQSNGK